MISWPPPGTRVTVRYRRPAGSVPPLTDAVGHLLGVEPMVRVRTKTGAVAEFAPADAVALRVLTDAPVRTSDIRSLEHADAAAGPAAERTWMDGWLLRADPGAHLTNSALPLDRSASMDSLPAIVDWYDQRGLTPRLALPDRLLAPPPGLTAEHTERVMVREVAPVAEPDPAVTLSPGDVRAGESLVGSHPGGAQARAAATDAPDGTRWVGLSALHVSDHRAAAGLCAALLRWGAGRGATRAYLLAPEAESVPEADSALAKALGFRLHHHRRYYVVRTRSSDTV